MRSDVRATACFLLASLAVLLTFVNNPWDMGIFVVILVLLMFVGIFAAEDN